MVGPSIHHWGIWVPVRGSKIMALPKAVGVVGFVLMAGLMAGSGIDHWQIPAVLAVVLMVIPE